MKNVSRIALFVSVIVLFILISSGCVKDANSPDAEDKNPEYTTTTAAITTTADAATSTFAARQSQTPYMGVVEITPLFDGYTTISDWIKGIKSETVEYTLVFQDNLGETFLYITVEGGMHAAEFLVEKNIYVKFDDDKYIGTHKNLPEEILALKVIDVFYLDFKYMGVPYDLRGITEGSGADELRLAFLDVDTNSCAIYTWKDVVPDAHFETADGLDGFGRMIIGGTDLKMEATFENHFCPRRISYVYTLPWENDVYVYPYYFNGYNARTFIHFPIDADGKVAGLIYESLTVRW